MTDDCDLSPDDLPKDEPPRVSPAIRLMATDPCPNCGGRVRLAAREDYGVANSSTVWRFEPEIEEEVLRPPKPGAEDQLPPGA